MGNASFPAQLVRPLRLFQVCYSILNAKFEACSSWSQGLSPFTHLENTGRKAFFFFFIFSKKYRVFSVWEIESRDSI